MDKNAIEEFKHYQKLKRALRSNVQTIELDNLVMN